MKNIIKAIKLTVICILLFGIIYPLAISGIGLLVPEKSTGNPIYINGVLRGYENIGQSFSEDRFFWGRPSAVDYNASATGGSNKGPTNPEYLETVEQRIADFLKTNPDVKKEEIPSELVTASGSGLDPHITPQGAIVQVKRISKVRNIDEERLKQLISENTETAIMGMIGQERVNVLKLNIALDRLN